MNHRTSKEPKRSTFKVTGTVYVEATSIRHAAHVAKGVFQMKANGPAIFTVEERTMSYGLPFQVDLSKEFGQSGYQEPIL
jgi:hypothetical protein